MQHRGCVFAGVACVFPSLRGRGGGRARNAPFLMGLFFSGCAFVFPYLRPYVGQRGPEATTIGPVSDLFGPIGPTSANLGATSGKCWPAFDRLRPKLGRFRPTLDRIGGPKLARNRLSVAKMEPILTDIGPASASFGEVWPVRRASSANFGGRGRPRLRQTRPESVELGPDSASFGPILTEVGPNLASSGPILSDQSWATPGVGTLGALRSPSLGVELGRCKVSNLQTGAWEGARALIVNNALSTICPGALAGRWHATQL